MGNIYLVFSHSLNFSFLANRLKKINWTIFRTILAKLEKNVYASLNAVSRPSEGLFVSGPLKAKSSVAEHDTFTERVHLITWLKCSRNLTLTSTKITRPWNFWIFDLCQSAWGVDGKIPLLSPMYVENGCSPIKCWLKLLDSLQSLQGKRYVLDMNLSIRHFCTVLILARREKIFRISRPPFLTNR